MTTPAYEGLEGELKKVYSRVPAPPRGLAVGREKMLAEAARLEAVRGPLSATQKVQTRQPERRRRMTHLLAYKVLAAVMAMVIAFSGAGGGVALAADSVPGDILYPVKLAVEDVRFFMTMNPAQRAELTMTFATERVREMERLVLRNQAVPDSTVARMTRQMEQTMAQIALAQPEEVPALMQRLMERTQTQQQLLEQLQTRAQEQSQAQLRTAAQVMERAQQMAATAAGDPQQFQQQYQHRYQGTLAPQEEPAPAGEPERSRNENQNRNETMTGPAEEPSGAPVQEQEQSRNEYQNRNEGPQEEPSPAQEQQQNQYQNQNGNEGAPGPQPEPSQVQEQEQQQSQCECQCCSEGDPCPDCAEPPCDCPECPCGPPDDQGPPEAPSPGVPPGNGR